MAQNTAGQTLASAPQEGITHTAFGSDTFDATAITAADYVEIQCGFTPRYVRWVNITDRIQGEWFDGMAADSCLKQVAAGTATLEVTGGNGGITIVTGGFRVLQNATLALVLASKVCRWYAQG